MGSEVRLRGIVGDGDEGEAGGGGEVVVFASGGVEEEGFEPCEGFAAGGDADGGTGEEADHAVEEAVA